MPKRLKGKESDPLVFLELGSRANNVQMPPPPPQPPPPPNKKKIRILNITEIRSIDNETNVTAGAVMILLREGQQESHRKLEDEGGRTGN